jgi:hypothetical protein
VTVDPGSEASVVVDERHRRDSHTSALTKEPHGMLVGRRETIFELADSGVDLPRQLGSVTSPPGLHYTADQE